MNAKLKILGLGVMAGLIAGAAPFVLKINAVPNSAVAADPAPVPSSAGFTAAQKTEMEGLMRKFIMENPQVLMDSVNKYREDQGKKEEASASDALKSIGNDLFKNDNLPQVGNKSGDITVVEFFDYNCGYCKKGFESVQEGLNNDKNIRFVFVDYPILSESSHLASQYALAAQKQGKYFEYHKALMTFQGPKTEETIMKLSKDAGIDTDRLKKDAQLPEIAAQLTKNQEMAQKLAISGTPAFIVGGQIIRGYVPYEALKTIIADERKKAG